MFSSALRIHSLTARFSLTLLLSTVVPLLVVGGFGIRLLSNSLEGMVVATLEGRAKLLEAEVVGLINQFDRDCYNWSISAGPVLESGRGLGTFADEVEQTRDFSRNYQMVLLVDGRGAVQETISSLGGVPRPRLEREALSPDQVSSQDWFKALQPFGGQRWVGRHLSPFLHRDTNKKSLDPSDYSIGLAFGLPQADGPPAALYALIRWQRIQDVIDAKGWLRPEAGDDQLPGAEAFLCDGDGGILAHSDRRQYRERITPEDLRLGILGAGKGLTSYLNDQGEPSHAASVLMRNNIADFSWRCAVTAPTDELFALVDKAEGALILATVVFGAILLVWSLLAARRILRPVRRLAAATELVARGDLSARVSVGGSGEIADLGRAFNRMAEDLSESRDQLRDAERQAAWAEMARQVAHEIKNPLTPMRMSAQLLLKAHRDGDARIGELIERTGRTVLEQTDALARIAADFHRFAGPPERSQQLVLTDDLLADVASDFASLAEQEPPRIEIDAHSAGATVMVDRMEIRRVFMNLVQNALEANGESGCVVVRSSIREECVRFEIHDQGPGVTAEVRAHLFEPYFTTRSSGTGLGLAICRRSVEDHGGQIGLLSSEPGATVFYFDLPLSGQD